MPARALSRLIGVGMLAAATPALTQDCRLALVLALDVSSSVNAQEDHLQRLGLAHALLMPQVTQAFLTGEPVALRVFEWSGPSMQEDIVPGWQMVRNEEDLIGVASMIAQSRRDNILYRLHPSTAVGAALVHASQALREAPECWARTIDISGDGESTDGFSPAAAYAIFPFEGVTVNALVVGGTLDDRGQPMNDADLVAWFEAEVLHGSGAFSILADGYQDYERAMTIKLVRELQMPMVSGVPVARQGDAHSHSVEAHGGRDARGGASFVGLSTVRRQWRGAVWAASRIRPSHRAMVSACSSAARISTRA